MDYDYQQRYSKCDYYVQPADTWEQPSQQNLQDESMLLDDDYAPPISMLNHHCLLKIFRYLDLNSMINLSEVCQLFNTLLHTHCFPRARRFEFDNLDGKTKVTLAQMRRILRCIGPYINKLQFQWNDYDHSHRLQRFVEKLGKYVGKNIRHARFVNALFEDNEITALKPILQHLTTLEIIVYNSDYELDIDFQANCPNLQKFKFLQNMQFVKCCKPWPTLQHLSIIGNEFLVLNTFREFFQQNPQITVLKFTAYHADDVLQIIARHLPNVRKLTILPSFPDISEQNIVYLSSLRNLKKLNLMYLDDKDIDGILKCLIRFTTLSELKLHLHYDGSDDDTHFKPNQKSIISLALDLPNLEKLCLRQMYLLESTVLDLIRFASNLKVFHIHSCDLIITHKYIWNIVQVLKSSRPKNAITPLKLFIDLTDSIDLKTIQEPDIQKYLIVNNNCTHTPYATKTDFGGADYLL